MLPDLEAGVGVIDGGKTAVWVELEVGIFLDFGKVDMPCFVRDVQFLEDDSNLPGVWA